MWAIIGTWHFSLQAIEAFAPRLAAGDGAMDTAVAAARMIEDDERVDSVGRGGIPNAQGECELDAAVMEGRALRIGAVAGFRHCPNPILAARALVDHAEYNLLCGVGADAFARSLGLPQQPILTEAALARWQQLRQQRQDKGHDTVCFLALSADARMAVAVTTSGMSLKLPGRVGDSPLVGSGFYADDEVGAAAATGLGEDIMKGVVSFRAVEAMRQGLSPRQAAEQAVRETHLRLVRGGHKPDNIAMVCLDKYGNFGAAANHREFAYAAAREGLAPALYPVEPVIDNQATALPRELQGLAGS
jgi:isoaspartyl peptidase/L-asparaginase-like protein (Ntn-hydrolase superfamily)